MIEAGPGECLEHKVHGNSALDELHKYSPTSSEHEAASIGSAGVLLGPSTPEIDNLTILAENLTLSGHRNSQRTSWSLIKSCFRAGIAPTSHGNHCAITAYEVGIRPCFYWVDPPESYPAPRLTEMQLWMKSDCQDDVIVVQNFADAPEQTFLGVFDGHGPHGRKAAKFVSTSMPKVLASKQDLKMKNDKKRLSALKEACRDMQLALQDVQNVGFDASMSGTTACVLLIAHGKVLLANTGDSRCVAARRVGDGSVSAIQLTRDAKPSSRDEYKRICESGGTVRQWVDSDGAGVGAHRVYRRGDDLLPGLAMSRSLGDLYAHAVGVTWEPFLSVHSLTADDLFLVAATDGLWDVMTNEEVVDFVARYRAAPQDGVSCAEALTLEAQERWKEKHEEAIVDDISAVIVHVSPPPAGVSALNRATSVPSTLARAASCNDEANELAEAWKEAVEMDPSYHSPQRFFSRLYEDEKAMSAPEGASNLAESFPDSPTTSSSRSRGPRGPHSLPVSPAKPALAYSTDYDSLLRPIRRAHISACSMADSIDSPRTHDNGVIVRNHGPISMEGKMRNGRPANAVRSSIDSSANSLLELSGCD